MFYADCNSVCPMLTNQLQILLRHLSPNARANTRILMVSLDPNRDTATALSEFRRRHHLGAPARTITRTDPDSVRLLAAVLRVRYRQLPDQTFNHSTTIALADAAGVIRVQTIGVLSSDAELVAAANSMFTATAANRPDRAEQRRR